MNIESIDVQNFRGFEQFHLDLDPQFTLLIGVNGSGKTSVLSALSVALGIWHVSKKGTSWRKIEQHEVRLRSVKQGDRITFERCEPVSIKANGHIGGKTVTWTRMIKEGGSRTTNSNARKAIKLIDQVVNPPNETDYPIDSLFPVLAFYGAGRSWMPSNERTKRTDPNGRRPSRWDAYYGSLNESIRMKDLMNWFVLESAARDPEGKYRPGFETVRYALANCIPGASDVWFDHDRLEPVIRVDNTDCLFSNLSDGQKSMAALVADIAIKAVTLNSHMSALDKSTGSDGQLPKILAYTPGVVLIDELDVHLHPKWQRRVVEDLSRTFPKIQFVCTTHSPQIIGEVEPKKLLALVDGAAYPMPRALGLDSSRVLEELMDAPKRNEEIEKKLNHIAELIDDERFDDAKGEISGLSNTIGETDPEITRANAMIHFLESEISE